MTNPIRGPIAAVLAVLLIAGGAAIALGAGGGSAGPLGNAAATQYDLQPPVTYTPTPPAANGVAGETRTKKPNAEKKGSDHGVEGVDHGGGNPPRDGSGPAARQVSAATTGPAGGADGLPFTGLDLFALLVIGSLLVLLGVAQRRLGGREL
jgi:hypothetical protein